MSDASRPAALLLHVRPDGSRHFDLLLATTSRPLPDDRVALAWRCTSNLTALEPGRRVRLEPIELHRALFLSLDQPRQLDRDRGQVEPIGRGLCRPLPDGTLELEWIPQVPSWTLRFGDDEAELDARDSVQLAGALWLRREL